MTVRADVLESGTQDARRALLAQLIDHAPLFPPAEMPLEEGLRVDAEARRGGEAWMLGRFVCPASVLSAVEPARMPPRLSVVLDGDQPLALSQARDAMARGARVDAIEVATTETAGLRAAVDLALGPAVAVYVEGARADLPAGLHAKVRCGGLVREAFPSTAELAAVIARCRDAGVAFKATAGLHQAFRHRDRQTGFWMHGFVNLLAACCLARARDAGEATLAQALEEADPGAFELGRDGLRVGAERLSAAEIADTRRALFHGYGSCSFAEPVDELREHGVLPL